MVVSVQVADLLEGESDWEWLTDDVRMCVVVVVVVVVRRCMKMRG